ncbi:MAG: type II toxin-antitoxin system MqsA family antitoxin [Bacillota bacterium]|nr:type II toxin-antitoxin system MqsA family antitoxin [Bacillota bacterium]MDH7579119.1 type II toxin-antitoxin system MqsA family antitoxin [Bacillota bacterium]
MVTRCYLCGGETVKKLVTAENWWGETLALVENVPAWVCEDCGEAYFDAETCKQLDRLRKTPSPPERTVQVSVYNFPEIS